MLKSWLFILTAWAGLVSFGGAAAAQEASPELRAGAERVVALIRGEGDPHAIFTPGFLAQVPASQLRAVIQQLTSQYGAVRGLGRITPQSPQAGAADVEFERATMHMTLVVDPGAPHLINTLFFTGADMRDDSLAAVIGEIRALPGRTSVAVARLGDGAPAMLAGLEPARPLAIGSAFKLWILAELSRQVRAGQRRWNDVVALDRRSMPGGTVHGWPRGSPVTLHTLAALMISQSDNSATDMLLHSLGRENVERIMATIGVTADARNRPLLSTLEMAAIKTGPAAGFNAWQQADEAGRRRMLERFDESSVDVARFTGNPLAIDSVEWFASAADLVRTMDWIRLNGDDDARAILAINSGLGAPLSGEFAYVGYKGGSEPGVFSLTWLIRNRAGAWHVVTGTWNNPAAPVEATRFTAMLARAVQLVR